jgi:predicted DNA-binding transcriptional regulator YafY
MNKYNLLKDISHGRLFEIIYRSDKGSWSKRRIKILSVKGSYLQAFCYVKKSRRLFKIENVFAIFPVRK